MMKTLQRCGVLVLTLALLIGILPVDTILYAKAQPTKKEILVYMLSWMIILKVIPFLVIIVRHSLFRTILRIKIRPSRGYTRRLAYGKTSMLLRPLWKESWNR